MSCAELIPDLSVIVHGWIVKGGLVWVKGIVDVLRRFKGVFRYRFGRLYSEVGWFNFILRRIKRKLLSLCFVLFFVGGNWLQQKST